MWWSSQGLPVCLGLALLIASSQTDARECKIGCHGSAGNILRYEPGKIYSYKLEGNTNTKLAGATTDNQSKIGLTADVQVSLLSSCEHALKVTNVQVTGPDNKKYNLEKLSDQPIKFGLQNGRVESELCVNSAEDTVGLNIKRAVVSLIQSAVLKDNGYATQSETDVFGTCPTGYEFSKSGSMVIVKKSRDLVKCAHREDLSLPYLSTPYYIKSDIQSSPLLISQLIGEQKFEGGILKLSSREENYEYKPGATPEATAHVKVITTLKYVSTGAGTIPAACTEPRSVIFESEHPTEGQGTVKQIVDLVKQGCDNRAVEEDTAQQFSRLVKTIASASVEDITTAFRQIHSGAGVKDKETAQRMLKDAIVMAQSASSVEVMAEILKRKEVKGNTAKMWLLALGSTRHASRASLLAVLPLLDGEPDVNAYFGIGSLAGKYCREHTCDGVNEINQLQIKLGAPLLKGCGSHSKKEENQLIASLKGLANIKYLGPKIAGKIIECVEDKNAPPRVRAAALDTIKSDPNKEQFKNLALNILKNVEEDSELRIKAYLVLAECPCGKIAAAIKDLLNKEESNQVGGFIVSHLRNLQATTNPHKQAARHHLGNIIPPRRFIIDPTRYSINQELSYSADIFNTGASGEANIIYSQNSYLPRTLSMNLTVQLFGTAYNLLELDTRAENFEHVAEKFFGPKGYMKTNEVEDIYEDGKAKVSSILEKIAARYDQALRPKRSITREQLNAIADKVHLAKKSDDVDLDLSLKVLGSEVLWQHVHGSELKKMKAESLVDDYFGSVDSIIQSLKNADIDYRRHISFLNREVTYPTSLGLALKLKTLGSAAIRVKLDGKLDLPAIIRDPMNTNARLQLIPSAAVNVAGEILIDAVAIEAGTRVDLNLHTSTGSDVTLRVLSGRGIDIKLGLPVTKQEVLSVKVDMTSIVRDDAQVMTTSPIKYDANRESFSACFDQINSVVGLTFCGDLSVPYEAGKPIYPIYGPMKLAVKIVKEDESLSAYHIKALYEHKEDTKAHLVELLLDTPNSKIDRKLSLTVEGSIQKPKRFITVDVHSPWTDANLKAHLVQTDKEKSINAKLTHDGAEYVARAGVGVSTAGNEVHYEPIFEYKAPEGVKSALIGKKGGSKPKQQSFIVGGIIAVKDIDLSTSYKFNELYLSTPRTKYVVDGTALVEPHGGKTDLKISYDKEHVTIHGKLQGNPGNEYHAALAVALSEYPDLGISFAYDLLMDKPHPGQYDSKLVLIHGPDPKSEVSKIYIHNSYERIVKDGKITSLGTHHEVTYPVLQLELMGEGYVTPKSLSGGLKGKLDRYSAAIKGSAEVNNKKEGDYQLKLDAELMGNELKLLSSHTQEETDKSRFKNVLTLKPGGTYQINAVVVHKFTDKELNLQIDADASVPNQPKIKFVAGLSHPGNKCIGHIKLNVGDKCLIEGNHVVIKGSTPSVNFKMVLTGHLEAEGKFTIDGSKVNGLATVNLPKVDRKMEAKVDLTEKAPKYTGAISVCYDTKDPSKTIKIQTDSSASNSDKDYELDSRNTLSHGNLELKINLKGKMSATSIKKGTKYGEIEVIFPNKYQVGGKYTESINMEGDTREAEGILELYDQLEGQQPQKLKLSAVGKHISLSEQTVDGQAQLTYTKDGKDTNIHVNLKKLPSSSGKTSNINGEVGASGDLIAEPIALKIDSEISNEYLDFDESISLETDLPLLTYKLTATVGNHMNIESAGKLSGPTISNQISAKFPESYPIKSLKIVSNNLIDIADESKEHSKIKLHNAVHWNDKHIMVNVEGNCEPNGVQYVVEYETDSIAKGRAAGSIHIYGEDGKADATVNYKYGGKTADLSGKIELNKERTAVNIHILSNTPDHGKVDVVYRQKVIKDGQGLHADITISIKDKKLSGSAKVEFEENHPLIDLNLDHPDGKSRFLFKLDKKGERHASSELKAKWTANGGGSISVDSEANLASVDNFFIKVNADGPQLNLKKLHVDISNKPAKGEAKKITFNVKSDDKVIISGTSNYNYKEEGDVAVLEGTGNVKIEDQSYPLTFQATRKVSENGEQGKLSIKAGKRTFNIESKVSPNEFSVERTYCKEPKLCSKAQISSKLQQNGLEEVEQTVIVVLDLSLFTTMNDISYKSSFKRQKFITDHHLELQLSQDSKFKYHAFIHETSAGAYLTLPKRIIGGEVKYDVSQKKDNIGSMKLELNFHLNKGKEPKLSLVAATTARYDKGISTLAGETKLTHPSLAKDLVVKGQIQISDQSSKLVDGVLEIDVSKDPNNKLISKLKITGTSDNMHTVVTIKSKGCNIDITYDDKMKYTLKGKESQYNTATMLSYVDSKNKKHEMLFSLEITPLTRKLVLRVPGVINLDTDYRLNADRTKAITTTSNLNLFGRKYHDSVVFNRDTNHLKYQFKNLEGKALNVDAQATIGSAGSLKVVLDDKTLYNLDVDLSESNFLKSKYSYDLETAKSVFPAVTKELQTLGNEGITVFKNLGEKQMEEFRHYSNCIVNALPDTNNFGKYVQSQLVAIRDEIAKDKSLDESAKFLKEAFGIVGEKALEIAEELNLFFANIAKLLTETAGQINTMIREILPKINESVQRVSKVLNDLIEQYGQLSEKLCDAVWNQIKEHEADIKAFADSALEFLEEIGKLIGNFVITLNSELEKVIQENIENLGELPIVADLQERLKEFKDLHVPEEVYNVYHEITEALKQFVPTPEVVQFLDSLSNVIEKVIKNEEIPNREEVTKQLYKELVAAIKSIITLILQNAPQTDSIKPMQLQSSLPLHLLRIPSGGIRISLVNLLTNRQFLPSLSEVLAGMKLSLNPLHYIPPYKGYGYVIGGTEVITYDGLHLNIQGTCSYILSEDYKDRNFSVVGQLQDGATKSITLTSGQDSIEIRPTGNAHVNGKVSTYPASAGEVWAWKRPNSVGAASKAGVVVICSPNLDNCVIEVSGYYHGRLRGLLGNLNGETYDERTTPDGKIVKNSGELANSWKLHGSCASIPTALHKHNRVPLCTEMFVDDTTAHLCRPFVNSAPFRDACDDFTSRSAKKEEAACAVSRAYTYACRSRGILIAEVHDKCSICEINGKKVGVDDTVKVESGNAADIVVVAEFIKENEDTFKEVATPLIAKLKSQLAKKGISDVRVKLVGGNPKKHYHNYYTDKEGQIAFDPESNNVQFEERTVHNNETIPGKLMIAAKMLAKETGINLRARMYQDVFEEDLFRPNALRAIIGVHGDPCSEPSLGSFARLLFKAVQIELGSVSYNVITPSKSFEPKDKEVAVLNENETVFMNGEKAKHSGYSHNDVCVSLAYETNGNALNADSIRKSPKKGQLLQDAADKITESILKRKSTLECSCSLRIGIVPQPDCSNLE